MQLSKEDSALSSTTSLSVAEVVESFEAMTSPPQDKYPLCIKSLDMSNEMLDCIVSKCKLLLDSDPKLALKDIAMNIKQYLDIEYGPSWHVIVGNSFGSYVTHMSGNFAFFQLGSDWAFLTYKTI